MADSVLPPGVCVIGHANPDTDTVCSAIAYAELCRLRGDDTAYAARQGELRPDTAWVLNRFDVEPPPLVTDVRPRIADVMTTPIITAHEGASLLEISHTLRDRHIRSVPIVDDAGRMTGVLALEDFARFFVEGVFPLEAEDLPLDLDAMVRAIDGTVLVAARNRPLSDNVRVAASSIEIVLERIPSDGIAVVGDRHDVQEALIHHDVGALIVTGGLPVRPAIVELARKRQVTLISCPHHTYATVRLINMSVPARYVMRRDPETARPDAIVADVRPLLATRRAIPVVDADQRPIGVFTRSDLLRPAHRQVVLIDHNEVNQAVAGLDEAEVIAIIDHHRLATIRTPQPILIRCEPVGATATIVAELYAEAGEAIPDDIAGLLLAAIVTDTVLFRSPTCTPRDRDTAAALGRQIGVDPLALGEEIFTRASDIRGVTPAELIRRDFKEFPLHGHLFGIAAIETGNAAAVLDLRAQLLAEMERLRRERPFEVVLCMIVDVVREQTDVLIRGHEAATAGVFKQPLLAGNTVVLPFVASRKKQVVPLLGDIDAAVHQGAAPGGT